MKHPLLKKERETKEVISLSNEQEVKYWAKSFGISGDALKRAVVDAGTGVKQVRIFLETRKMN